MAEGEKKKGFRLSSLKTDAKRSEEGVWQEIGEGFEVKVARLGHPEYKAYVAKLSKPHLRSIQREGIGSAKLREIQQRAVSRHILLDWRGLHDDDGSEIPYSQEKALELLSDPDYSELLDIILELAQDVELFRAASVEEAAGN